MGEVQFTCYIFFQSYCFINKYKNISISYIAVNSTPLFSPFFSIFDDYMKECITCCYFFPRKNIVFLSHVKLQSCIMILSEAVRNFYIVEIFMHQKHISKFIGEIIQVKLPWNCN